MCIIPADAPKDATEDTPATTGKPAKVYIDVNGSEKPNIGGRDMFTLYIYDDFSIDDKDITPDVIKTEMQKQQEKLCLIQPVVHHTQVKAVLGKL